VTIEQQPYSPVVCCFSFREIVSRNDFAFSLSPLLLRFRDDLSRQETIDDTAQILDRLILRLAPPLDGVFDATSF
jgi:hypothetical protein